MAGSLLPTLGELGILGMVRGFSVLIWGHHRVEGQGLPEVSVPVEGPGRGEGKGAGTFP